MKERKASAMNGYVGLLAGLLSLAIGIFFVTKGFFPVVISALAGFVLLSSITVVQPNEAKVVVFLEKYLGSIRTSGLWLVFPFSTRTKISLRVRNFNSVKLKVNDVEGNPIEIAAVVVLKVVDTAKAMFDVFNYENFVEIQSETALRHIASKHPYDNFNEAGYSLRGNSDIIAGELMVELQERLGVAGVEVIEARLTHLAYATEIASAMLQRQQAAAIISARAMIVEGAVGMVQMAIAKLEKDNIVELDNERKAAMVNNLMVAIVSDRSAPPVINTGSLY